MLKQFVMHRVLPALNPLLRKARVKIAPWNAATRDLGDLIDHLKTLGMDFRTVIDVGVAHGSPGLHDRCSQAKFFLVDPVPALKDSLQRLAGRLGGEAFNVAAGSQDGEMTFYVHSDTSGSSAYQQEEGALLDGRQVTVPVRRLDTIIPRELARPALLKIDTQGAELEVVEGASGLLDQIDMIVAETSFHQMRKGTPEVHQVIAAMAARGFVPYEMIEGFYRPIDGAMAQIDVAFVPEDSPLRRHKAAFSPEQAADYAKRYDR